MYASRIGTLSDVIYDIDKIPNRNIIDKGINQHGHELIEFLIESKMCTLNVRFTQNTDNYTSVSKKVEGSFRLYYVFR